ncbi:MAG: DUF3798 domain-containing protein [Candidatus Atribacteria bacterium]|nr:DUF3798 domain-containing protein [Candidatus Atribacteria bacterium]
MNHFRKNILLVLTVVLLLSVMAFSALGQDNWKIGILTSTVTQNEEEFRAAQHVLAKYGPEHVIVMTYPDKFMDEQETTIANMVSMASDPDVKALIICQAVPGTSPGIDSVKEIRDDLLIIVGTPHDDPPVISPRADIVLAMDDVGMGYTIPVQAQKLGARTLVHYSFPRHMAFLTLSTRRDIMKEECARLGLDFVEADSPDPTGDAGITGSQQFILEDVPRMVEKYGKDTCFFSTNCSQQIPLISAIVSTGALYAQPCCPSPYHGFPSALGIEVSEDKMGDLPWIIEEITKVMAEKGVSGRLSTWPAPVAMMFIEAGAEYAKDWIQGKFTEKMNIPVLLEKLSDYAGVDIDLKAFEHEGVTYDNFLVVLLDYITF